MTQHKIGIETTMYLLDFVMSLFTAVLPPEMCARIFDIYFFENDKILYRAMLAIMKILENLLLSKTLPQDIQGILKMPYKYMGSIGQDRFIEICLSFTFSQTLITKLEYQYSMRLSNQ